MGGCGMEKCVREKVYMCAGVKMCVAHGRETSGVCVCVLLKCVIT